MNAVFSLQDQHFPAAQEQLFRDDYYQKSVKISRAALLFTFVLFLLFGVLDAWAIPSARNTAWLIRFGIIGPELAIAYLLTYFPIFRRWMQPILSLSILTVGLGIATIIAHSQPDESAYSHYYAGILLVVMGCFTFMRLRFRNALLANIAVLIGFEVVAIGYQHLLTTPMGIVQFLSSNFFFAGAMIIGGGAGFYLEQYARRDFAQRRAIEIERTKSENALQQEAAEAIRASELRFRTLIEISVDGIVTIGTDGIIQYLSPAFEQMLGGRAAEHSNRHFTDIVHLDDVGVIQKAIVDLLAHPEQTISYEYRIRHKDDMWRIIEGVAKLLPDGNIVSYNRDVTERKQAELALRASDEALRKLNADLEQRVTERTAELEKTLAEQRRLAAIIEATTDYVGIADLEGWSLYVNQAGRRMVGKPEIQTSDAAPWNVANCYPAEETPKLQNMIETALRGDVWSGETAFLHRDGHIIPVSEVTFALRDVAGNIESIGTIVRDISQQKQVEKEIQQAREAAEEALAEQHRLTAILEATTDLVTMLDMQGRGMYMNRAGRKLIGLDAGADITHVELSSFYAPEVLEKLTTEYIPAAMRDGAWFGENEILNRNGQPIPVSQVGLVLRDEHGAPEFLATIIRDITEQKRVEVELRQARDAADVANRAKSSFLANMSHEIRTPMNGIIGMTSLLLDTPLTDKQRDFVEIVRTSSDSLLTIINDILDFSKIEANKLELVSRPFDLRECVEASLDLLAPRVAEKKLDLAYVMDDHIPATVVGDVTRLRQILVNLLSNAVKFTEQGEVVLTVSSVPISGDKHELHFAVRDTGIGIPANKMDGLFKSFSQLDASTTREYGGTGLGLVISKRLSEMMGGTMWAESEGITGRGSIFHCTLIAQTVAAPMRTHLQSPQSQLRGNRVLIVDDNATNRRILSLQVQNWGMIPQEAALPSEALAMIEQGHAFDVAILDMHMPEMDGIALGSKIRTARTDLPLMMLTSVSYQADAVNDFTAFLTKPIKPSELYDALVTLFADQPIQPSKRSPQEILPENAPLLAQRIPLRILLAEDVLVNQKFAVHALDRMGYRVDTVANGLETLEAVRRQPYDVILMDVQMPEMDGLEATRKIRQLTIFQPRIIAMTANAMQGDREICLDAGMDDYISKPVYMQELQAALERAGQSRGQATSTSPSKHEPPILNVETLEHDLAHAFLEEAPSLLTQLEQAVKDRNAKGIRDAAHSLKGSSAYLKADRLTKLSGELEQAGRTGNLENVASLFVALDQELIRVLQTISTLETSE